MKKKVRTQQSNKIEKQNESEEKSQNSKNQSEKQNENEEKSQNSKNQSEKQNENEEKSQNSMIALALILALDSIS